MNMFSYFFYKKSANHSITAIVNGFLLNSLSDICHRADVTGNSSICSIKYDCIFSRQVSGINIVYSDFDHIGA